MLLKRKTRLGLILTVTALCTLLMSTSVFASAYAYMWNADGYGNKIRIWISYSAYGGNVKVEAIALYIGGTFFGVTLGTPIFYGESIRIYIYGKSGGITTYFDYYSSSRGWQFSKNWGFSLPSGLDAVTVYAYARFDSIIFGHSSVSCSCYAS